LSHGRGYTSYFESWNPNVITEEEAVVEGLKHLFVTQSLDSRIEDALPLLARIQQQGNAMKEANIFEAWADKLTEGTWATPDTPEKQQQLIELLSTEFPVGPDATNATEQLYNLLGDDELFDQLEELSTTDPDADCRQVIMDRMDMLSDDPDIQSVVAKLQIDPSATMNPAEPTDAGASANPDDAQIPTNEEDLEDVTVIGGDSSNELMADVMTNQQGDEIQENDLDAILRIAGVPAKETDAVDYELEIKEEETDEGLMGGPVGIVSAVGAMAGNAIGDALSSDDEETDEGKLGALGGGVLGMAATKTPGGAIAGAKLGSALQDRLTNKKETALQGEYGHSGKLRAVADKPDFLTRLKELSGMIRN
jgi:ribosomal protein L12E/L44/L45/RPP1/RPP2